MAAQIFPKTPIGYAGDTEDIKNHPKILAKFLEVCAGHPPYDIGWNLGRVHSSETSSHATCTGISHFKES